MIGLFGGTFDPVHYGHLRSALEVKDSFGLDEVRIIPCAKPPHRKQPEASATMRLQMLELAIKNQPGLKIDTRELDRHKLSKLTPSYMVDTLKSLRQDFKDASLLLFIGSDAFKHLTGWHQWQQLFDYAHLVVLTRPENIDVANRSLRNPTIAVSTLQLSENIDAANRSLRNPTVAVSTLQLSENIDAANRSLRSPTVAVSTLQLPENIDAANRSLRNPTIAVNTLQLSENIDVVNRSLRNLTIAVNTLQLSENIDAANRSLRNPTVAVSTLQLSENIDAANRSLRNPTVAVSTLQLSENIDAANRSLSGVEANESLEPPGFDDFFNARLAKDIKELAQNPAGKLFFFQVTQLDISATAIRNMIAKRQNPGFLLPDAVIEYIKQNQLYETY
jgi:nicotinate (nicotinamide) nucleotide adenylyltransferase